MHILHVIESLEFGGAEKVVVHLANKLSQNYTVSICLTKRKGELIKQLNENIKVHFLDSGEGNSFETPKKIQNIIKDERIDVVHSHDWGVYLESAFSVKNIPSVKLIHTVHGRYTEYPEGMASRLKVAIRHFLERRASKYTDKIVPVSHSIAQYIQNDIGISKNKIQVIHNGISDLKFEIRKAQEDVQAVKFVTVGRLAKVKNFPMLLKAFKVAHNCNLPLTLDIVGDGPEMQSLVDLAESLNMRSYVNFLGFRTDVHSILSQSDVFVLSSEYEGISIAVLEAMSLAMPVIATNVGGIPETVVNDETGYIVECNDVEGFAKAILALVGAKAKRQQMGTAGKLLFHSSFHEDVVLSQYQELYASL